MSLKSFLDYCLNIHKVTVVVDEKCELISSPVSLMRHLSSELLETNVLRFEIVNDSFMIYVSED